MGSLSLLTPPPIIVMVGGIIGEVINRILYKQLYQLYQYYLKSGVDVQGYYIGHFLAEDKLS